MKSLHCVLLSLRAQPCWSDVIDSQLEEKKKSDFSEKELRGVVVIVGSRTYFIFQRKLWSEHLARVEALVWGNIRFRVGKTPRSELSWTRTITVTGWGWIFASCLVSRSARPLQAAGKKCSAEKPSCQLATWPGGEAAARSAILGKKGLFYHHVRGGGVSEKGNRAELSKGGAKLDQGYATSFRARHSIHMC